ncbi:hypothetical protein PTKIN_Ptkin15bG0038600 [Pterospermum kingtungense]
MLLLNSQSNSLLQIFLLGVLNFTLFFLGTTFMVISMGPLQNHPDYFRKKVLLP